MTDEMKDKINGQLRVLLSALSGFLVGKGLLNAEVASAIMGFILLLWPMIWSWWSHKQSEKKTQEREVKAVNAGIAVAQAGVVGETARPADVPQIIKEFAPETPKGSP